MSPARPAALLLSCPAPPHCTRRSGGEAPPRLRHTPHAARRAGTAQHVFRLAPVAAALRVDAYISRYPLAALLRAGPRRTCCPRGVTHCDGRPGQIVRPSIVPWMLLCAIPGEFWFLFYLFFGWDVSRCPGLGPNPQSGTVPTCLHRLSIYACHTHRTLSRGDLLQPALSGTDGLHAHHVRRIQQTPG